MELTSIIWNSLEINEKEKYLRISHKYYLAFKYKDLIYQKKIRRIFPRKPFDAFQFFLNEKKGIKIPEGNNTVIYWREKYNELDDEVKKKYIKQYNIATKEYKSKLDTFKDKVSYKQFNYLIFQNLQKILFLFIYHAN